MSCTSKLQQKEGRPNEMQHSRASLFVLVLVERIEVLEVLVSHCFVWRHCNHGHEMSTDQAVVRLDSCMSKQNATTSCDRWPIGNRGIIRINVTHLFLLGLTVLQILWLLLIQGQCCLIA